MEFAIKFLIFYLLYEKFSVANKYTEDANVGEIRQSRPFRMQKLNLFWEEATKRLESYQLDRLFEDLKHQDKIELDLKRIKAADLDSDGTKEAEVRKQMRLIAKKYGLDMPDTKATKVESSQDKIFSDIKLDSLWKKVSKMDLAEDQLAILKEEFEDFQEQMRGYQRLANQLTDNLHQAKNRMNHFENRIDSNGTESEKVSDEIHERLQKKHLELKNQYKRINDMVMTRDIKYKGEFDEEQTARLWRMALKSDFTQTELDNFKEKLLHYQNRLKKHRYFSKQLKNNQATMNEIQNEDDLNEAAQHQYIKEKVDQLDGHIKKLHRQLEEKVLQRHSEL